MHDVTYLTLKKEQVGKKQLTRLIRIIMFICLPVGARATLLSRHPILCQWCLPIANEMIFAHAKLH